LTASGILTAQSDASVSGNTAISGNATVAKALTVSGATSAAAITASGLVTANAGLTVSGGSTNVAALTASGILTAQSDASVSGNTAISGNATVAKALTVSGATSAAAITASGLVTANAGLTVSGATNIAALTASGTLTAQSDASVAGNTAISGNATVAKALTVSGATSAAAITASGLVTASNGLTVTGATNMAALTASGIVTAQSDASVAGNTAISGNATVAKNLTVSGATSVAGLTASGATSTAAITASGLVTANAGLTVTGSTNMAALTASGIVTAQSDASVAGNTAISGNATVAKALTVSGATSTAAITASGLVTANAGLTVTGATNMAALTASGIVTAQSDASVAGNTAISGNATVAKNLTASGLVTANNGLTVTGATTVATMTAMGDLSLNGNVSIAKDVTIVGRLNVQQYSQSAIINTTTTNYALIVSEDLSLNGRVYSSGDASFNGSVYAGKSLTVNGNINVNGNIVVPTTGTHSISGTLTTTTSVTTTSSVLGNETVTGSETIGNGLFVTGGDASFNNRLFVLKDASMSGNVAVAGNLTVNGTVSFPAGSISAATISGGFPYVDLTTAQSVAGVKTFSSKLVAGSDLSANGNVAVAGNLTVTGTVSFPAGSISSSAISGGFNYVDLTTTQSVAGVKTFTDKTVHSADLSANGNVSIAGNLNVTSLTGYSTATSTLDSWMLTNLINAPPAVNFGTPTVTSSYIYLPWSYPTQIQAGALGYLPLISQLTIEYGTGTAGTRSKIANLLANAVASDYINNYSTNSNPNVLGSSTTPITGVIFAKASSAGILGTPASTKEATTGTIVTTTFGSDSGTRRALLFYDSTIASLNSGNNFYVNVYYKNNNTNNNLSYLYPTGYTLTGFPSAPRNVSEPSFTSTSMTIQYFDPSYGDALNNTSSATVNAYQLTYQSWSNVTRYGGNVYVPATTITASVPSNTTVTPGATPVNSAQTTLSTGMYPDASYSITVQAKNTGNVTYGTSSPVFYASTAALTVPTTNYNISGLFPTNTGSSTNYYSVATQSQVNNLIVESAASAKTTTSSFKTVVNDYSTRGTNGSITSRMYLTASVSGATTATCANVAFNTVYPIGTLPSAVTLNNITITPTNVVDYYSASGSGGTLAGYDGFYQEAICNMKLETGLLVPSSSQYTVTLTRSCTSGVTPTSSAYSFYYDNLTGNPGAPSITSFALGTVNSTPICGVNVIYGTPAFTATYSVTNLGSYFYKNPLINYSSTDGNSNTIVSGSVTTIPSYGTNVTANKLNNSVAFSSMAISGGTSTSAFTTSIPLTITANNINGSTSSNATAIAAIIDCASYTLITSTLPSSVATLSTSSAVIGARVQAGTNTGSELTTSTGFTTSYAATNSPLYDHTQSLLTANTTYGAELQIANGSFQTKSGSTTAYLNYPSYSYPTNTGLNYTTISASGYRYATFAWKIPSNTSSSYTSVTFTINGVTGTTPTVSNYSAGFASGTKNIQLYYRTEDSGATAVGNSITTYWIDANSKTGIAVSSSNASATAALPLYGLVATPTASQFSVLLPLRSWASLTGNAYLYCKIGLPMDQTYAFQYITASLGTASATL